MKIIIHKGSHQIGGSITEIATDSSRIVIDMGADLPNSKNAHQSKLIIDGVTAGSVRCDGVLITHYHGDHLGLFKEVLPGIPVYIGHIAKEVYLLLCERIDKKNLKLVKKFQTFKALDKVQFGDIVVTPLFIDHSAFDAYMFLIEAEGKKILHTGDFRTHGVRGSKLIKMLKCYVGQVDVLITEGTLLIRANEKAMTEYELQQEAKKLMAQHKYVFILCSSTNIDRIFSFIHAKPDGKPFICDSYQKEVLELIKKESSKHSDFYNYENVYSYAPNLDDLMNQRGFCMLIRSSDYFKPFLDRYKDDCLIIYSMWKGYLNGEAKNEKMVDFLAPYKYTYLHTSGHATTDAIKEVCDTVRPKNAVIPIHTENPDALIDLCVGYSVKVLEDGDEYIA